MLAGTLISALLLASGGLGVSQKAAWPRLPADRAIAMRTQRDVSTNITISSNVVMGVNMTEVLWQPEGYNSSSLGLLQDLLNVGIQAFALDLYYNEYSRDWGLCPYSVIQSGRCGNSTAFNLTSVVSTFNTFLSATDTFLSTNVMYVLLSLNSYSSRRPASFTGIHRLKRELGNLTSVATPDDFDVSELPTMDGLLSESNLRVFTVIVENNLPHDTKYDLELDLDTLFEAGGNSDYSLPVSYTRYNGTLDGGSGFRFVSEGDQDFTVDQFRQILLAGSSPIVSHSFSDLSDISTYLDNSFWSWAPDEPTVQNSTEARENPSVADEDVLINRCAIVTPGGWVSVMCTAKYRCLCRRDDTDLAFSETATQWMTCDEECSDLDSDYRPTSPFSAAEQRQAISLLGNSEEGVWINVNSLSTANCWVVGTTARCPYQRLTSRTVFIKMMITACAVTFALLCIIIAFQFERVPVLKNRRHWRKLTNEKFAQEQEGVPS